MQQTSEKLLELLESGTAEVLPHGLLKEKLAKKERLCIKLGMDPTAPDLHLGHAVVLSKMKQFQDAGHEIIFLIGDFTAAIGDPTGRSKTRPPLTSEEISHNTTTYFDQVKKILNPDKVTVRFNSEWLSKLAPTDLVKLCGKVTLARVIEREDFAKRIVEQHPIGFHELLYPLFQGYDSVALKADVELGGTDQTFNLLMGRFLQEQYGQPGQVIMTVPILEGLDGVQKMSKSLGNTIGLTEPAPEAFGKLMSISDILMWRYFELLLNTQKTAISAMQESVAVGTMHPMELKKEMAYQIVAKFWSPDEAAAARENFEALFQRRDYSQAQLISLPHGTQNPIWIIDFLKALGAISGSAEGKRLLESNAVKIDGNTITDFKAEISWQPGMQVKVGKHRMYQIN